MFMRWVLGTDRFPTQVAVERHLEAFVLKLNSENPTQGRWPAHRPRRIAMSREKLCPVHRSLIAMSGRVAQVRGIRNEGGRVAYVHT
jgi:hypothetical protein